MFGLTLTDHLRLTFGHVIYSHRTHTEIAARHLWWHRALIVGQSTLLLATAVTAVTLIYTGQWPYGLAAAVCASCAVVLNVVQLVGGFDRSAMAHRACGARLWLIREQYRALLADLHDGAITIDAARERRDGLMTTLQRVYEDAPPADRERYEAARKQTTLTDESALSDEEIDRFLPLSLRKAS